MKSKKAEKIKLIKGPSPSPSPSLEESRVQLRRDLPVESKVERKRYEETQKQVDEVIDIMHENVNQIMKRGDNLEILSKKAVNLESGAQIFKKTVVKIERKYWWSNMKMWIILIITCVVLLGISAALIYFVILK